MPAMKSLTFGVGGAALASAIGFIYAQAASDSPPLVPRFVSASPQQTVDRGLPSTGSRAMTGPSSAPSATPVMNRQDGTAPQPAPR